MQPRSGPTFDLVRGVGREVRPAVWYLELRCDHVRAYLSCHVFIVFSWNVKGTDSVHSSFTPICFLHQAEPHKFMQMMHISGLVCFLRCFCVVTHHSLERQMRMCLQRLKLSPCLSRFYHSCILLWKQTLCVVLNTELARCDWATSTSILQTGRTCQNLRDRFDCSMQLGNCKIHQASSSH